MANDVERGTSDQETIASVASDFEGLLSGEPEYQDTNESQPTPVQSPESEPDPGEVEASSEQAPPEEGETEPDETTDEPTEESVAASLDPNTRVKVKVDGEEQEITIAEALKGYSREAVFTRRMQEVAEQRKAVDATNQALRGEREVIATQLTQLKQVFEQQQAPEPDWAQVQKDYPEQFANLWAQHSQYKERLAAVAEEAAQAQAVVERDRAEAVREHLKVEQAKILELIPEWKDEAKAKAEKTKIATYAQDVLGFKPEEIAELRDSRGLMAIRKAMLWDALQAKKPAITQRIQTVKAATPGPTSNRPARSKSDAAFARLAKSGSEVDFAAGLEDILDD